MGSIFVHSLTQFFVDFSLYVCFSFLSSAPSFPLFLSLCVSNMRAWLNRKRKIKQRSTHWHWFFNLFVLRIFQLRTRAMGALARGLKYDVMMWPTANPLAQQLHEDKKKQTHISFALFQFVVNISRKKFIHSFFFLHCVRRNPFDGW